jgi:hypothetical protein
MMTAYRFFGFATILVALSSPIRCQTQKIHEQKIFNAEDLKVERPVEIPKQVLMLLAKDDLVSSATEDTEYSAGLPHKEWFAASLVSRDKSEEKLYLILGKGPLLGSHVTTFWLVGHDNRTSEPAVLFCAAADQLIIGKMDESGYPKLTVVVMTQNSVIDTVLHYVAGKYIPEYPKK